MNFLKDVFSYKKTLIFIAILLIALGLYFFKLKPKATPPEVVTVQIGNIKSVVSASGTLAGKNTASLKFNNGGKLAYLNITKGDQVKKGQTIAGLDTRDLEAALREANQDYLAKNATAQRAEDDVKGHDTDESFTQKEERVIAQSAQNIAYDQLKQAQLNLDEAVITSPINGIVTEADFLPEQFVAPTDLIAQIVDWSQVLFDAQIDEADLYRVKVGQTADVTLDSYPGRTFTGTVSEITPDTQITSSGETVVVVRIDLHNPDIHLISGLDGEASIVDQEIDNVLTVPLDSIINDNTVFKQTANGFVKTQINLGLSSDSDVEVKSGLTAGDKIAKNPSVIKN